MTDPAKANERLLWALQERAKELGCLYEVEELLDDAGQAARGGLRRHHRGHSSRLAVPGHLRGDHRVRGPDVRPPRGLPRRRGRRAPTSSCRTRRSAGSTSTTREEMPHADEGPFLKEEGKLIRTIADRVGHFILHQQLRGVVQEWRHARDVAGREAAGGVAGRPQPAAPHRPGPLRAHLAQDGHPPGVERHLAGADAAAGVRPGPAGRRGRARRESTSPASASRSATPLQLADEVFALAQTCLSGGEILDRIERWIHEDRSAFLVQTVANVQASPEEVANAIRRYLHLVPEGAGLSPPTLNIVRVSLIRRFLSREPAYLQGRQGVRRPRGHPRAARAPDLPAGQPRHAGRQAGGRVPRGADPRRKAHGPPGDRRGPAAARLVRRLRRRARLRAPQQPRGGLRAEVQGDRPGAARVPAPRPGLQELGVPARARQGAVARARRPARHAAHRALLEPARGPARGGLLGQVQEPLPGQPGDASGSGSTRSWTPSPRCTPRSSAPTRSSTAPSAACSTSTRRWGS